MKIDFEFETQYGTFRDALYLEDDHQFTQQQVIEMQNERLSNWIFAIENPPPELDLVEIDGIQYEKIELDGQIVLKPLGA